MDARQAGHRRKAELAGDDGTMREDATGLHDQALCVGKERHPCRIGGGTNENIRLRGELGSVGFVQHQGSRFRHADRERYAL